MKKSYGEQYLACIGSFFVFMVLKGGAFFKKVEGKNSQISVLHPIENYRQIQHSFPIQPQNIGMLVAFTNQKFRSAGIIVAYRKSFFDYFLQADYNGIFND